MAAKRFTASEVALWRMRHKAGLMSTRDVMNAAGVGINSVYRMLSGETYRDVPDSDPEKVAYLMAGEAEQRQKERESLMEVFFRVGQVEDAMAMNPTEEELKRIGAKGYGPLAQKRDVVVEVAPQKKELELPEGARKRLEAMGFLKPDAGYPD